MARRWVVAIDYVAQEVWKAKVAVDGVVKPITSAVCAMDGVARQFFPTAAGSLPPQRIVWTSDALTVTDIVANPLDAAATITLTRDSGTYQYSNDPNADGFGTFLNPPLSGEVADDGKYLIKFDQISGDTVSMPVSAWIDLNDTNLQSATLSNLLGGDSSGVIDISIAEDNGAGSPESGTTVTKRVTFIANVTAETYINWSNSQNDLVEIKSGEDADCVLIFNPDGSAAGQADTSGSFTENWHVNAPTVVDPENFTVTATLVSGTAPTGSSLATILTLDEVRSWTLTATEGEDLSCELDVKVDDLVPAGNDVTKRVTMNSVRSTPIPEPDWDTTAWSCTDAGFPQSVGLLIDVHLTFAADGTAKLEAESNSMPLTEFETGTWLSGFSGDLNDYECMIQNINGGGITTGQTEGQWVRMAEVFTVEYTTLTQARTYTFDANVRKVGGLATTKVITVDIIKKATGAPA